MNERTKASADHSRMRGKARGLFRPGGAVLGERREQPLQADADEQDQQQRQPDGFHQHAAQARREQSEKRFDGGVDHCG